MVRNTLMVAGLVAALAWLPNASAQEPRPRSGGGDDAQAQIRRLEESLEKLRVQMRETEAALRTAKAKVEKDKAEKEKAEKEKGAQGRGRGPGGMGGFGQGGGRPGNMPPSGEWWQGFGGFGRGGMTPPGTGRTEDVNAKLDRIAKELEEIRRELRNRR